MKRPPFAINLIIARKRKGYTQQEVACRIFRSQKAYAKYEEGKREPSHDTWILLCLVLGIDYLERFISDADYFTNKAA